MKRGWIFFCWDETTFSLKPNVAYGWFLRGNRPSTKLNWTRKNFHAFGANNGEREHYRFYDKINWKTTHNFLQYLHYRYPRLIILWDGAPWHRKKEVRNYLKRHDIKTLDFPAYTPELNPVENTWSTTKQKASNTYVPDEPALRKQIRRILQQKNLTKMFKYLNH